MSNIEKIKEIKINSMKRVYAKFLEAQASGTLKRVPLSAEEKRILAAS